MAIPVIVLRHVSPYPTPGRKEAIMADDISFSFSANADELLSALDEINQKLADTTAATGDDGGASRMVAWRCDLSESGRFQGGSE